MGESAFTGGCLCGKLRYTASGEPAWAGYCHCRLCQRSTGAPVLAWASFPNGAFRYSQGTPTVYRSSEQGEREFCARCGTQLLFRQVGGSTVDINLGSLDEPSAIEPRSHTFAASRIPWFDTADALPRHEGADPEEDAS